MTLIEAINMIDSLKPNVCTQMQKILWLSDLDGKIKTEIIDTHEGAENFVFEGYNDSTDLSTALLVPPPYDNIYLLYLEAMIDRYLGEYLRFENSSAMYNSAFTKFAKYYNRTHMPLGRTRSSSSSTTKGNAPYIKDGFWWIGNEPTFVRAEGRDGQTPRIENDGFWWIGGFCTNVRAEAKDGETPYIKDGFWWIGNEPTFVRAEGRDGVTPHIGENGNWYVGNTDTGIKAQGAQGDTYNLTEKDKSDIADAVRNEYFNDVDTALDTIIAIQNTLIGGDGQ